MPHDNYNERRAHIKMLLEHDGSISGVAVQELAVHFACGKTAIYRDIAHLRNPITSSGYRDIEAANNQNARARRMGVSGTFTAQEWRSLRERYDNRCVICGEQKPLGPDHIRPLSKGGTNWISNIQPMCQPCNSRKGARYARSKR